MVNSVYSLTLLSTSIVPLYNCLLYTSGVTSIAKELGYEVDINEVKKYILDIFSEIFKVEIQNL